MVVQLNASDVPRPVEVDEHGVHINLLEDDPTVVRVVGEADDPERAVRTFLRVGAAATLVAKTDFESHVVERRFDGMTRRFDSSLDAAVTKITDVGAKLLDEETGALPRTFRELKDGIGAILDETFNEDSKKSAVSKFDAVLRAAVQQLHDEVRKTFDPDSEDAPLSKTRREILEAVHEHFRDLRSDIGELTTALAVKNARAVAEERTAVKGFSFEDLVEEGLTRIGAVHGDVVERVGTRTGAAGTKAGDLLVTVNPDDTAGNDARFVVECKDRKLSHSKVIEELERGAANHDAVASLGVFSRQDLAPTTMPFVWWGNRAVLVYDKDDPDDAALQLAYCWARWVTRRELAGRSETFDAARAEAALQRARKALAKHQAARACFTSATNKISEGSRHVDGLVEEVRAALRELWDQLEDPGSD
ncbi:MAG TPA: hypothetical protein VKV23_05665 [Acidimicrobiales bacterium]|nr:hypothetical protein [Acidimicrobiales bacterium]